MAARSRRGHVGDCGAAGAAARSVGTVGLWGQAVIRNPPATGTHRVFKPPGALGPLYLRECSTWPDYGETPRERRRPCAEGRGGGRSASSVHLASVRRPDGPPLCCVVLCGPAPRSRDLGEHKSIAHPDPQGGRTPAIHNGHSINTLGHTVGKLHHADGLPAVRNLPPGLPELLCDGNNPAGGRPAACRATKVEQHVELLRDWEVSVREAYKAHAVCWRNRTGQAASLRRFRPFLPPRRQGPGSAGAAA